MDQRAVTLGGAGLSSVLRPARRFTIGHHSYDLSLRALIMGVINVTQNSFSDGGQFFEPQAALEHAQAMVAAGADIIDIGGESTRPFATPISLQEELDRVIPIIETLRSRSEVLISIDTYKAVVAQRALKAGANLINDISALRFDPDMADLVAETGVPVVLMHMQGTPQNMQIKPQYQNLIGEIKTFFQERLAFAVAHGISRSRIILDPGIGFGKNWQHNLELIQRLDEFQELGCPILLGPSRKAFIGKVLDLPVTQRDIGTLGVIAVALMRGANIIRTHNVLWGRQVINMVEAILHSYPK
ncbi:MAG: dihydropteroate synthase [Deltaproteobacteria bacterium]|nr:dihydropteroate synthase [Deltaproteobacteria bacterium]MBW1986903.1 dihydropteroate synthase [Deltaproteobacteria bacterium]MBW2135013.1 dihydropteroate synthase [Deltaproteobacteria bacterium]